MRKKGGRTSAYTGSSEGEQGFWPSYADMMSAVALILFFVMLLSYIQNMITGNNLKGTEAELNAALEQLAITSSQVKEAQDELKVIFDDLEIARQDLDKQQIHIDEQQSHIEEQANYILEQQANISAQKEVIDQQKAQADLQQQYLSATQAELSVLRKQMQDVALLRVSIVDQIRKSAENAMGADTITVSDNGNLVLSESVLFDRSSADLKANSRAVLDQLADGFAAFLSDENITKYVDTIIIGGHADSTGSDQINWDLSTRRAKAVLSYLLMTSHNGGLNQYAKYFSAAGYGSTRPIADNSTPEGMAKNRRIEISIVLKDDTVQEILDQYLAIKVPDAVG